MVRQKKNGAHTLILAAGSGAIFAMSAFTLYHFSGAMPENLTTASVKRPYNRDGTVLVPDGAGSCHKYIYANDTGRSTYTGTADCDNARPTDARANLPPALRGMQDSLRGR